MKILHIAYSLSEQSAAFRLAEEQCINHSDQIYFLLVRKSTSSFIESRRIFPFLTSFIGLTAHLIDNIAKKCFVQTDEVFSFGINLPLKNWIFENLINRIRPDVIHIHWGGYSFITPCFLIKLSKLEEYRLIVTTHDYYYFTGGCHIPMDCREYINNCQSCPMAKNEKTYLFGNKMETISSVIGKNLVINTLSPMGLALNAILHWIDKDHSLNSINSEVRLWKAKQAANKL